MYRADYSGAAMAEVLIRYTDYISARGREYLPRACARVGNDGMWEAWIEFVPRGGGTPIRTARESEQSRRDDLVYWAQGLSVAYLEGALERALRLAEPEVIPVVAATPPAFSGPAPRPRPVVLGDLRPVLDPFETYLQGEDILRSQLRALSRDQLEVIVAGYRLTESGVDPGVHALSTGELIEQIVSAVKAYAGHI
jgi:hypothetical protein